MTEVIYCNLRWFNKTGIFDYYARRRREEIKRLEKSVNKN